jgi:hypothetical protein
MFDVRYKGLRLIPSKSAGRERAGRELLQYGLMIADCKEFLENGYEPRKRGKDTIEKWMDFGDKTYNVVIVKSYNYMYQEDVYLIKHVGKFTKKKFRR